MANSAFTSSGERLVILESDAPQNVTQGIFKSKSVFNVFSAAFAPARWPKKEGRPFCCAHLLLPSGIITMCFGWLSILYAFFLRNCPHSFKNQLLDHSFASPTPEMTSILCCL